MKSFFRDLFDYNVSSNRALIVATKNSVKESVPKAELLMSHVLNAHHIWNHRILKKAPEYDVWELTKMEGWHTINEANTKVSESILDSFALEDEIIYTNTKNKQYENSVQDILFHIINHSNYHRAQIAVFFRQVGVVPLASDYIFHKRERPSL